MKNDNTISLLKTINYALKAHGKQLRKGTELPYIMHPMEVAQIVAETGAHYEVVAAAILHDVLEDTAVTAADMFFDIGPAVTALVEEVSDVSKPEDGNRTARKALDREHLSKSSPEGATIKLADIISNTRDIASWEHDDGFKRVYVAEMEQLLPLLGHGNGKLWQRANYAVLEARAGLP